VFKYKKKTKKLNK